MYDVIIIGGGPAGLSAALILGRSRRRTILFDSGKQRNRMAHHMHGYLSRDGIVPGRFLQLASIEVRAYGIEIRPSEIVSVRIHGNHFEVIESGGKSSYSKKLLIATGMQDIIPELPRIKEYYGKSVFHCPYCDGYEVRDKRLCVFAQGKAAFALSKSLQTWSRDVTLLTGGETRLSAQDRKQLETRGIRIIKDEITDLSGTRGMLEQIVFKNEPPLQCDAMFFSTGQLQRSGLALELGCAFSRNNHIITDKRQRTNVKGVFAAGDAIKDMSLVIVAAGEGAKAGVAINMELQSEE